MTDLNVDHITAPTITPDQWAAIKDHLEQIAPDLVEMLCGENA